MNKLLSLFFVMSFAVVGLLAVAGPSQAAIDLWGGEKEDIQREIGYDGEKDPRLIAATIINVFLGFLGIIAVVLIIWAGFNWMTAAGNEEKIDKAKDTLTAAVIGLIIILAAWGISTFVMNELVRVTS